MVKRRSNQNIQENVGFERDASKNGKETEKPPIEIKFDYIKSNQFRVIHVDGVHGGSSPKGLIQMAFFSERNPIPKQETYELEKGMLAKRKKVEKREAIVREVEVEALFDLQVAEAIVGWLQEKIVQIRGLMKGEQ
jgi:hypothetical protein